MTWLEVQLEAMAEEVRTRRLVVTEADGFERVVAETHGEYGRLCVNARLIVPGQTDGASVQLYAGEEGTPGGDASCTIITGGNPATSMDSDGSFHAYIAPRGHPGLEITHSGVVLHPMRLYAEEEAWKREVSAHRRSSRAGSAD